MNWHPSDFRGRDVQLVFKATEKVFKRPIGRPKKLPIEILECKRSDRVWSWSDHVSALEAQAGHQFHEDWRASGLEPVQAQRLEEGDCGSQARTGSTDWAADDVEGYDPPGSTVGMPKSGAVKADESVTRTYSGSTRGTLHIIFKTKDRANPNDQVPDAIARVERDLMRAGFGEERGGGRVIEVTYDTVPRSIPKRMSAETVARLIKEFEERTGRTDHRVAPKRRGKRKRPTRDRQRHEASDGPVRQRARATRRRPGTAQDRMAAGAQGAAQGVGDARSTAGRTHRSLRRGDRSSQHQSPRRADRIGVAQGRAGQAVEALRSKGLSAEAR